MVNGTRVVAKHVKRSADSEANNRTAHKDAECEKVVDVSGGVPSADAVVGIGAVGEDQHCADEVRVDVAGLVV
jgi:hypothetical protein